MFLIQEKELKSQSPSSLFHYLPPITTLEVVTKRLLWLGFFVLTIIFALGFIASPLLPNIKEEIDLFAFFNEPINRKKVVEEIFPRMSRRNFS